MTAVRPPILPTAQAAAQTARPDAARLAAQKAFFDMALGKAAAPPTTVAAAPATPASAPPSAPKLPEAGAEKPQRILRPGSLLDIRV